MKLTLFAALSLAAIGCGGDSEPVAPPVPAHDGAAPAPMPVALFGGDGKSAEEEDGALAALGARPAWTAVTRRADLLERRAQSGAVIGRLGRRGDQLWLADESRGDGALAIRVAVPAELAVKPPFRAVVWGAWRAEGDHWVWAAQRIEKLRGGAALPARNPGLVPMPGAAPAGALPISELSAAGGDALFVPVAEPLRAHAGWPVADTADADAALILFLPGEDPIYGGQNYLGADERWQLEVGQLYSAPIGRRRRQSDSLHEVRATAPPVAVGN